MAAKAKIIRVALYVMLLASAAAAVLMGERLWQAARAEQLPAWAPLIAPSAFTAFVLIYGVDRWLLVRRGRFPPARALFQFAVAMAFLTFLWPDQLSQWRAVRGDQSVTDPVITLLGHRDDQVRAAACELLGWREQRDALSFVQKHAQTDRSTFVRQACEKALTRLDAAPR